MQLLQASELADLEDEANMPLEQLLARYGYATNPAAAGPSHAAPTPPHPNPPAPVLPDPLLTQKAGTTHSRALDPAQQTRQTGSVQSDRDDRGTGVATLPGKPSRGPPSASTGGAGMGAVEGVAQVRPEEQAEQAAAAGMDAFEHSQALAERRASGSQAGPSATLAPGKALCTETYTVSVLNNHIMAKT